MGFDCKIDLLRKDGKILTEQFEVAKPIDCVGNAEFGLMKDPSVTGAAARTTNAAGKVVPEGTSTTIADNGTIKTIVMDGSERQRGGAPAPAPIR